jgi:hypothetical protein
MTRFRFSVLATFVLLVALVALFRHDPLQAQGRLPRSVAWEYKIIHTDLGAGDKSLQEAGAQGWECVSFAFVTNTGGSPTGSAFLMKRPKVGQ